MKFSQHRDDLPRPVATTSAVPRLIATCVPGGASYYPASRILAPLRVHVRRSTAPPLSWRGAPLQLIELSPETAGHAARATVESARASHSFSDDVLAARPRARGSRGNPCSSRSAKIRPASIFNRVRLSHPRTNRRTPLTAEKQSVVASAPGTSAPHQRQPDGGSRPPLPRVSLSPLRHPTVPTHGLDQPGGSLLRRGAGRP